MTRRSKRAIEREIQKLEASKTDARSSLELTERDRELIEESFADVDPEALLEEHDHFCDGFKRARARSANQLLILAIEAQIEADRTRLERFEVGP